jgi:hypothetical protein
MNQISWGFIIAPLMGILKVILQLPPSLSTLSTSVRINDVAHCLMNGWRVLSEEWGYHPQSDWTSGLADNISNNYGFRSHGILVIHG